MKGFFDTEPSVIPTASSTRGGGRGSAFSANNYVAQPGPDRGNRKGAGAPRGNCNAFRHGNRSAAMRAFRVEVRLALARFEVSLRIARAELARRQVAEAMSRRKLRAFAKPLTIDQDCSGEERAKRRRPGANA